jgi:DnaJ-class molecular chaperone
MQWRDIDLSYKNLLAKIKQQNPYERLGVTRGASLAEVKQAYRKKMRAYHPDRTDVFMQAHCLEIAKLFNEAMEQIKKELKNDV